MIGAGHTNIKLDGRFRKQAKGAIERYHFDVGVIQDSLHKNAVPKEKGLKTYAGGPARRVGRKYGALTVRQVSEKLRKHLHINFYTAPFRSKNNGDLLKFLNSFFKLISGKGSQKRLTNSLQAVVRNPILRGDYGRNTSQTAKEKGFNRLMIDTAQLFKAIKATVHSRV